MIQDEGMKLKSKEYDQHQLRDQQGCQKCKYLPNQVYGQTIMQCKITWCYIDTLSEEKVMYKGFIDPLDMSSKFRPPWQFTIQISMALNNIPMPNYKLIALT